MVEKVYEFRDGGVKEYLGGIYYFLEKRKLESLQEIERRDAPAKMPAKGDEPKPAVSGKLSYEQRKEQEKQLRKDEKGRGDDRGGAGRHREADRGVRCAVRRRDRITTRPTTRLTTN